MRRSLPLKRRQTEVRASAPGPERGRRTEVLRGARPGRKPRSHRLAAVLGVLWLGVAACSSPQDGTEIGNPVLSVTVASTLPSEVSLRGDGGRFALEQASGGFDRLEAWTCKAPSAAPTHAVDLAGLPDNPFAGDFADGLPRSLQIVWPPDGQQGALCRLALYPRLDADETVMQLAYSGVLQGLASAKQRASWRFERSDGAPLAPAEVMAAGELQVVIDAGVWLAEALQAPAALDAGDEAGGMARAEFAAQDLEPGLALRALRQDGGLEVFSPAVAAQARVDATNAEASADASLRSADTRFYVEVALGGSLDLDFAATDTAGELEGPNATDEGTAVAYSVLDRGGVHVIELTLEQSLPSLAASSEVASVGGEAEEGDGEVDPGEEQRDPDTGGQPVLNTTRATVRVRDRVSERRWTSAPLACELRLERVVQLANATRHEGRIVCLNNFGGRLLPTDPSSDGVVELGMSLLFGLP